MMQPLTSQGTLELSNQSKQEEPSEKARRALEVRLSKTKLCRYFSKGKCKHEDKCHYAHGIEELANQPNLQKTKMCQDFLCGTCQKGASCSFAHGPNELTSVNFCYKTTQCIWYAKGMCRNGVQCQFLHGKEDPVVSKSFKKQAVDVKVCPPTQDLKQHQIKPQIQHLEPQYASSINNAGLPLSRCQFRNDGSASQNGTHLSNGQHNGLPMKASYFGDNGGALQNASHLTTGKQNESPNFFYALQPPLMSFMKLQDTKPPQDHYLFGDAPDASPFLGTLRDLQTRLNDISRMNESLGLQCRQNKPSHESPDTHLVDNLRLSEETINSHQVGMLAQDIQSLTNQISKLKESIVPHQNATNFNGRSRIVQSKLASVQSSTDDSSSTTTSTPSPNRGRAPPAPGYEGFISDLQYCAA